MREIWCWGLFPQKWKQEMGSILVSSTDGVLNIDGTDAKTKKEREQQGRETLLSIFPLGLTWSLSGKHFFFFPE